MRQKIYLRPTRRWLEGFPSSPRSRPFLTLHCTPDCDLIGVNLHRDQAWCTSSPSAQGETRK